MTFTWTIKVRLNICGYPTPEFDVTAPLAVGLVFTLAYCLMLQTPVGG